MNIEDYLKKARLGDIIDTDCPPGHLRLVLGIGIDMFTYIWVEKENGEYKAKGYNAERCFGSVCVKITIIDNINQKNNKLMKITNLVKKLLDEDTRKLVKAGFINGDLALTDEGVSEILGILFLQNKDELVKIADEKITETK